MGPIVGPMTRIITDAWGRIGGKRRPPVSTTDGHGAKKRSGPNYETAAVPLSRPPPSRASTVIGFTATAGFLHFQVHSALSRSE